MNDQYYDELLNIKTCGDQKGFTKSFHYHRYEPTPYHALEALFQYYPLTSNDRVVDFGCGKGRLNFFINHLFNSQVVGIEMNEEFYQEAISNRERYYRKNKHRKGNIDFYCCLAEEYLIDPSDNYFYFFNPFSIQIFRVIVNHILVSLESHPREIHLVLYYVSEDYIYFLENQTNFELAKEVIVPGLYERNQNERFLIYRLSF
ncbi:methyltransferase domain-containing protein [Bacillus marasmi]|uniref:methyltransferase domain-containing protein n=1 Tax=Bacillus marasmi TaxID=1926279 RepID=UPI0011CB634B|nr:methyltransferase domain-containing protein [Bacillus marasmi]